MGVGLYLDLTYREIGASNRHMKIGSISGSYGMYPFMTRVSVGDRPVTSLTKVPEARSFSEDESIQPFNIPTYNRDKAMSSEASRAQSSRHEQTTPTSLSVYA